MTYIIMMMPRIRTLNKLPARSVARQRRVYIYIYDYTYNDNTNNDNNNDNNNDDDIHNAKTYKRSRTSCSNRQTRISTILSIV